MQIQPHRHAYLQTAYEEKMLSGRKDKFGYNLNFKRGKLYRTNKIVRSYKLFV